MLEALQSRRNYSYLLGIVFIVLVACIWAGASVLIQYIYSGLSFESPFMLTYICTSLFSIYLPWVFICSRLGLTENPPLTDNSLRDAGYSCVLDSTTTLHGSVMASVGQAAAGEAVSVGCCDGVPLRRRSVDGSEGAGGGAAGEEERKVPLWSHARTFRVSLRICPLWFLANYTYNLSLGMTSITSNTIISTTSSLWTFLFSTFYGLERFTWAKLGGLLLCFTGTILVGLSDEKDGTRDTVVGDALCLFSAVMYGVYTTALRVVVPDDNAVSLQLLFGYIGLINGVALLPVLVILLKTAPYVFAGFSATVLGFVVLNGLCDNVLSDYLWARAIVLTSPTVATVGLSLTIPLAFFSDLMLGHFHGSAWEVLGALSVFAGFVMVSWKTGGEARRGGQRGGRGEEGEGGEGEWEGGRGKAEGDGTRTAFSVAGPALTEL